VLVRSSRDEESLILKRGILNVFSNLLESLQLMGVLGSPSMSNIFIVLSNFIFSCLSIYSAAHP
jgi:hypothetical protein